MNRKYMYLSILAIFLLVVSLNFNYINAEENTFTETDQYNNLRLGNDYVVIVVNQDENSRGRFAIETTGGAPLRNNDDNKPLVYGRPKPWTSYTTIRIDGKNYIFGGSTERRAGRNANYGEVIRGPKIEDEKIITTTEIDDVLVEQILSIVKSTTTGLPASARIKYRIENQSEQAKDIGLRIMLDTMLGENDGAPFRIGKNAVTTDTLYLKEDLSDFWQAFDSISSPQVTSQGTLTGQDVNTPHKVYFSDWGSLADGTWDFDFNIGEEFIRKGEYEIDSAMAMFWEPETLASGETRNYVTKYGLGGITIVPGLISLGVTSPAEVVFDRPNKTFPIIAYIENTSEIKAKNIKINLDLPSSFSTVNPGRNLGDFESGDISQVIWQVKPVDEIPQKINYTVTVSADNTDSNEVEREVEFLGPPDVEADIELDENLHVQHGQLNPNPFKVQASITNTGGSILYDAVSEIVLAPGLVPAASEKLSKQLGYIKPGETVKVNWQLEALRIEGTSRFALEVHGANDYEKEFIKDVSIPGRKPLLYLTTTSSEENRDKLLTLAVNAENIQDINQLDFAINYNPEALKPVFDFPGNVFVRDGKLMFWEGGDNSQPGLIKFKEMIPANKDSGTIASILFKVIQKDKYNIEWDNAAAFDDNNNKTEIKLEGLE